MSDFIVSARKYRPATFRSVVGQKHITTTLQNAIERGQLAHAYLFCGPRGVGKTTCARIFAKAINCLTPHGAEACNACESCRSFDEGRSMNIHELDAASNNSVDDIRSLIEQVRIIPQVGRYSVFIIDEVHMLSPAAFNAFLKTLEEPPAHAIFILATTEKHKIIPTILSRCQIYDFNRIRVEDSVEYLRYIASEEGVSADEESLNLISQKADGGMRDALSMFDKAVSFCGTTLDYRNVARTLNVLDYDTYFGITDRLLAGDYVGALVAFDEVLCNGFSGQTFLAGLNRHMRDLLMAKRPETLRLIEMTGALLERYRTQAQACDTGFLFGAISCLTELDGKIRQSSSQRLLVELGLMKIAGLGQKKNDALNPSQPPLPDLTARPTHAPVQTPAETAGSTATTQGTTPGTDLPETMADGMAATGTTAAQDRQSSASASAAVAQTGNAQTGSTQTESVGTTPVPASSAASQAKHPAETDAGAQPEATTDTTQHKRQAVSTPVAASEASPATAQAVQTINPTSAGTTSGMPRQPEMLGIGSAPETDAAPTRTPNPSAAQIPATALAPAPAPTSPSAPVPVPAPAPARSEPRTSAPARPGKRSLLSGTSLSELLATASAPGSASVQSEAEPVPQPATVDPACAAKLTAARQQILNLIREKRPRFVPAFEQMALHGNVIALHVPTPELREEMLRSKIGMLTRIASLAGVEGPIELDITVTEAARAVRPFKLEDRVKYMTEKNPLVAELRKALDLEAE